MTTIVEDRPARPDPAGEPAVRAGLRRPAAGPVSMRVLLLHGMGLSGAAWDGLVRHADPGVQLWQAGLPWTRDGGGEWTADQDVGRWVCQALAGPAGQPADAARESGPGARPFFDAVVAHSYSATALLGVLATGRVPLPRAVVLIAPFYRARAEDFDLAGLAYSLQNFPRLFEQGIQAASRRVIPPEVLTAMAAKLCAQLGPRTWIRFTDTYLATPGLPVARVRTPVLVVGGDHDPAAAPSDARALADRLPDARLRMLPDCGHFAMVEQPAPFADLVGDFLGATCGGAGPAGD